MHRCHAATVGQIKSHVLPSVALHQIVPRREHRGVGKISRQRMLNGDDIPGDGDHPHGYCHQSSRIMTIVIRASGVIVGVGMDPRRINLRKRDEFADSQSRESTHGQDLYTSL